MEDIILQIQTYQEDNPHVVITEDMIKGVIQENIDSLVKEIKEII